MSRPRGNGNQTEDSRFDGFGVSAYKQNAPFGWAGAAIFVPVITATAFA